MKRTIAMSNGSRDQRDRPNAHRLDCKIKRILHAVAALRLLTKLLRMLFESKPCRNNRSRFWRNRNIDVTADRVCQNKQIDKPAASQTSCQMLSIRGGPVSHAYEPWHMMRIMINERLGDNLDGKCEKLNASFNETLDCQWESQ